MQSKDSIDVVSCVVHARYNYLARFTCQAAVVILTTDRCMIIINYSLRVINCKLRAIYNKCSSSF